MSNNVIMVIAVSFLGIITLAVVLIFTAGQREWYNIQGVYLPPVAHEDIVLLNEYTRVEAGHMTSYVITPNGKLRAWGGNHTGQLARGANSHYMAAQLLPLHIMNDVVQVSATGQYGQSSQSAFALAIRKDGTLWGWGRNSGGLIGAPIGGFDRFAWVTPIQLMEGVLNVEVGQGHALVIRVDNSLYSWGSRRFGQVGDGVMGYGLYRTAPVRIMEDVISIAASASRACHHIQVAEG